MARVVDLYPQKGKKAPASPVGVRMPVFPDAPARRHLLPAARDVLCYAPEQPIQQWFTRSQLCKKMGISAKALQHLLTKERLPYVDIAGETYFDPADVTHIMNGLKQHHHRLTR